MIKLDEKDVKAIGRDRFNRRWAKWFAIVLVVSCGLMLLSMVLTADLLDWRRYLSLIPTVAAATVLYIFFKGVERAGKELVEKWKEKNE